MIPPLEAHGNLYKTVSRKNKILTKVKAAWTGHAGIKRPMAAPHDYDTRNVKCVFSGD
jgi:hypothetical protein